MPACVVMLVAAAAGLILGQTKALVSRVDVLVAGTATGRLDHLLVWAVTRFTGCRGVHLDSRHIVLRVLVTTDAVPGWIRRTGLGLTAREVVTGGAVAQRVGMFGNGVAHRGAPLMTTGARCGPRVVETTRR